VPAEADLRREAPVAIVDIGSNSVRLVAYEGLSRALTPTFNEKVLCGLGKGVATTGLLAPEAIDRALAALRCFSILCRNMGITDVNVVATAATRDARNGTEFLRNAKAAIGADIHLIGGQREAELSALGVASSFHRADGVVGDMGGGSLELIDVKRMKFGRGVSLPLGGLALADMSKNSPKRAQKIAREAIAKAMPVKTLNGRTFYAVGGTWRALAKLHMRQRNYPLNVMHGYVIPAAEAGAFASLVERVDAESLSSIAAVSSARRPLLSFGAVVLDELIRQGKPREIVISAQGVREGLLFERLDTFQRAEDPLLAAARRLNRLQSRSPGHGIDLGQWTDAFMKSTQFEETGEDKRMRRAACLLADIAWRAHPDYRSDQALNMIANGTFVGVDHPGRGYLALAVTYRHIGMDEDVSPQLRALVSPRLLDRARILGAAMRVAYLISAAMADVLPRTSLRCVKMRLVLTLPPDLADLASDRLLSRLRQLAKLIGREGELRIAPVLDPA
jgi:exopolyphosphatase/guanosine-5'-triphosphate,3'-diphosphate pyrophosphatase